MSLETIVWKEPYSLRGGSSAETALGNALFRRAFLGASAPAITSHSKLLALRISDSKKKKINNCYVYLQIVLTDFHFQKVSLKKCEVKTLISHRSFLIVLVIAYIDNHISILKFLNKKSQLRDSIMKSPYTCFNFCIWLQFSITKIYFKSQQVR